VVDAGLDWREWTDQQNNRREAVALRARQMLFEGARSSASNGNEGGADDPASPPAADPVAVTTPTDGPAGANNVRF
jgi:hypothetical protein